MYISILICKMPIDVVQWRVRIGLFHSEGAYREMKRRCGCKHQKIKIKSLVGDVSFVVAVALLAVELIRAMVIHSITVLSGLQWRDVTKLFHTTLSSQDDKPSVSRKSTRRSMPNLITDLPSLTAVCIVVLHSVVRMLLLLSGDVEQNPGPEIILNVGDLSTLTNILRDAAPKWITIGDQLGFTDGEIKTIQNIPQCTTVGDTSCIRELLAQWLKWAPPKRKLPTLETLATAVREAGEQRLAYDLPQVYQGKKAAKDNQPQSPTLSTDEESLHGSQSSSATGNEMYQSHDNIKNEELSLPHLDTSGLSYEQAEALKGRLIEETRRIMLQFQNLVTALHRSLAQRVSVEALAIHLSTLGAFSSVKQHKPILDECLDKINEAPNMIKVFWILRDYFSFFNYHIIEHIITGFCTKQDKLNVQLQQYKEDFRQYCKRKCTECPVQFGRISSVGQQKVTFTLDANFQIYRIEELQAFRHRLAEILQVSEVTLYPCHVHSKRSIDLVFQVPTFVAEETFPLSDEQENSLVAEGVMELVCGEYRWTKEVLRSSCLPLLSQSDAENIEVSFSVDIQKEIDEFADELEEMKTELSDLFGGWKGWSGMDAKVEGLGSTEDMRELLEMTQMTDTTVQGITQTLKKVDQKSSQLGDDILRGFELGEKARAILMIKNNPNYATLLKLWPLDAYSAQILNEIRSSFLQVEQGVGEVNSQLDAERERREEEKRLKGRSPLKAPTVQTVYSTLRNHQQIARMQSTRIERLADQMKKLQLIPHSWHPSDVLSSPPLALSAGDPSHVGNTSQYLSELAENERPQQKLLEPAEKLRDFLSSVEHTPVRRARTARFVYPGKRSGTGMPISSQLPGTETPPEEAFSVADSEIASFVDEQALEPPSQPSPLHHSQLPISVPIQLYPPPPHGETQTSRLPAPSLTPHSSASSLLVTTSSRPDVIMTPDQRIKVSTTEGYKVTSSPVHARTQPPITVQSGTVHWGSPPAAGPPIRGAAIQPPSVRGAVKTTASTHSKKIASKKSKKCT